MKKLSLVVSHLLHLTREERAAIQEGMMISRMGVSIPTWVMPPETASDPVYEIVSRYRVGISSGIRRMKVEVAKNGYDILLPYGGRLRMRRRIENIFPDGGGYFDGIADASLNIDGEKVFIGHTVCLRPIELLEKKVESQTTYCS